MATKKRQLKAHNKLLLDVIRRQAGSLDKAVLEGVMNAVEAGSPKVQVGLEMIASAESTRAILSIRDKGKGITTVEEIEKFFDTFGQPHEASENKIWAQFRMGRGQIFSFGRTTWRTHTFRMVVDINTWGLDYEFDDDLDPIEGCEIDVELYQNPIGRQYNSVDAFQDNIQRQIEFMSTPVEFNGTQLNHDPATCKWDDEDENAYYLWGIGSDLKVYNLGAFVRSYTASDMGVTGVVVSKRQLKVNFARNDIQHDCEVWDEIRPVIRSKVQKKVRNVSRRLNRDERINTLMAVRDSDEYYDDVKNITLIETTSGRSMSLMEIARCRSKWTFAESGIQVADKIMQSGEGLCLDEKTYKQLAYSGPKAKFFEWLLRDAGCGVAERFATFAKMYRDFEDMRAEYSESHTILPVDKLTRMERRTIKVLEAMNCWQGRAICIGISDTAAAWTDGQTYIALDRHFLRDNKPTYETGSAILLATMIHECAHDDSTLETHVHGEEFYRLCHDIMMGKCNLQNGVSVARGYDCCWEWSPMSGITSFRDKLRKAEIQQSIADEKAKEQKAMIRRNKKLGVGTGVAVTNVAASVKRPDAPKLPKRKATVKRRRLAPGAVKIPKGL